MQVEAHYRGRGGSRGIYSVRLLKTPASQPSRKSKPGRRCLFTILWESCKRGAREFCCWWVGDSGKHIWHSPCLFNVTSSRFSYSFLFLFESSALLWNIFDSNEKGDKTRESKSREKIKDMSEILQDINSSKSTRSLNPPRRQLRL